MENTKNTTGTENTDNTDDRQVRKEAAVAIMAARSEIVMLYPFYGSILMNLKAAFANRGTAATEMRRIIFDQRFVLKLDRAELQFVMMHEVMHNVLKHCIRGVGKLNTVYNSAADIVANSNILNSMGIGHFTVDGYEVMHKAPNGEEGYQYSAEEVYDMLLEKADSASAGDGQGLRKESSGRNEKSSIDTFTPCMGSNGCICRWYSHNPRPVLAECGRNRGYIRLGCK